MSKKKDSPKTIAPKVTAYSGKDARKLIAAVKSVAPKKKSG